MEVQQDLDREGGERGRRERKEGYREAEGEEA